MNPSRAYITPMTIRPLKREDLPSVKEFTDDLIGKNYFSLKELQDVYEKSLFGDTMCSFVLVDDENRVRGLRLAYPPGRWSQGKGAKLRPDLWKVPLERVGYFQSLFLDSSVRGQGWGPRLSAVACEALKKSGAQAIVAHGWKESPHNSSVRYLAKFGFEKIISHPLYWAEVDYECVRDGKPCRCTAEEMIKYL